MLVSDFKTGEILAANDAFLKLSGYARKELLGKTTIALSLWKDSAMRDLSLRSFGKGLKCVEVITTLLTKSGVERAVSAKVSVFSREGKRYALKAFQTLPQTEAEKRALSEERKYVSEMRQFSKTGSWEYDVATGKITWSPEVFELYGFPAGVPEPDYPTLLSFYASHSATLLQDAVSRALATGEPYQLELEARVSNKTKFHFCAGYALRDERGNVVKLLGFAQDVTERKEMERAVQESEARFRSLIEYAPVGIAIASPEGQLIQSNAALQNLLGYSAEELQQLSVADITHPADCESEKSLIEEVLSGRRDNYDIVKRCLRKDGSEVWVNLASTVVRDSAGRALYGIGVVQNITAIKELEKSLRESRELFESVVNTAAIGICVTDEQGRYVLVNPAYCKTYGYSKDELIGKHFSMVIPTEDQLKAANTHSAFISGDPNSSGEWRLLHKDGRLLNIYVTAGLLVREDGKRFKVTTVEDITERKRAAEKLRETEEALRQSQKMEAVGVLASGIAHDFNNILGGILGNVKLLYRRLQNSDEQIMTPIARIELSVNRAAKLIQQLLGFVRKGKYQSIAFDPQAAIRSVMEILSQSLDRRITLKANLAPNLPQIIGDPNQIEQVFLNLLVNAADAIAPKLKQGHKGNITVSADLVSLPEKKLSLLELAPRKTYLRISFSDNGAGIPPEIQSRIFDPFFTTKEVGKGTGLGLSMVYGTVKNHQGAIEFETALGEGTTFHLYFPPARNYEPAEEAAPNIQPFTRVMTKRHTILLIEDEEILRSMIEEVFGEANFDVVSAIDGEDGLAKFEARYPNIDLVLLDMNMPNMNGERVYEELLKYPKLPPVIIVTGYADDVVMQSLRERGVSEFVMKPYDVDDLLRRVCEMLEPQ